MRRCFVKLITCKGPVLVNEDHIGTVDESPNGKGGGLLRIGTRGHSAFIVEGSVETFADFLNCTPSCVVKEYIYTGAKNR